MKFSLVVILSVWTLSSFAQMNQVDSQGRKQGEWGKTYEKSKVYMYRGQFKDDKPVGKFQYFYKNKHVRAVITHDEFSNRSEAFFYHDNSRLMSYGIYRDMKKDSVWINFTPEKRLSSTETYKNGELHGRKVVFYIPFDPNDKSRLASNVYNYVNGKLDGPTKELFENQKVKSKGQYKDNRKVGVWVDYHFGGRRRNTIRYYKGRRHGWCFTYDQTGKELNRVYFYFGKKLEGEALVKKLAEMEEKGIDPNGKDLK